MLQNVIRTYLLFKAGNYSLVHRDHILSAHPSVRGQVGCIHLLVGHLVHRDVQIPILRPSFQFFGVYTYLYISNFIRNPGIFHSG